jgi:hypothetical protein
MSGKMRTYGSPTPTDKNLPKKKKKKKKSKAVQYCDSNELIELTWGASRVLMSKTATNNVYSNKHKA